MKGKYIKGDYIASIVPILEEYLESINEAMKAPGNDSKECQDMLGNNSNIVKDIIHSLKD